MHTRAILTVLGADRCGIVAGIAAALAESGVNIEDIRQTIIESIFSMTMIVTLDESVATFAKVQERLTEAGDRLGVQVQLQREDVFRYMHRI